LLQKLKEIVRGTEQFCLAAAEGKLLRLPTGDGGALVFRNTPEAPALCALEISQALKSHPELRVRMGIHSGPVNEVEDLNDRANITGAGINIAQRVMDCGDAGHILLSKHVADDLEQYPQWRPLLHDLGEREVKHGVRLSVFNLYTEELGNPELPEKFQRPVEQEQTMAPISAPAVKDASPKWGLIFAAVLMIGALAVGNVKYKTEAGLFKQMIDGGARVIAAVSAVVFEHRPVNRANLRWIIRRELRSGGTIAQLEWGRCDWKTKFRRAHKACAEAMREAARVSTLWNRDRSGAVRQLPLLVD
jgi:hypothetical protein